MGMIGRPENKEEILKLTSSPGVMNQLDWVRVKTRVSQF